MGVAAIRQSAITPRSNTNRNTHSHGYRPRDRVSARSGTLQPARARRGPIQQAGDALSLVPIDRSVHCGQVHQANGAASTRRRPSPIHNTIRARVATTADTSRETHQCTKISTIQPRAVPYLFNYTGHKGTRGHETLWIGRHARRTVTRQYLDVSGGLMKRTRFAIFAVAALVVMACARGGGSDVEPTYAPPVPRASSSTAKTVNLPPKITITGLNQSLSDGQGDRRVPAAAGQSVTVSAVARSPSGSTAYIVRTELEYTVGASCVTSGLGQKQQPLTGIIKKDGPRAEFTQSIPTCQEGWTLAAAWLSVVGRAFNSANQETETGVLTFAVSN